MIELLIVVAVMAILMGIALPMAKTGIDGARTRAAAEIVREQFRAAQSLAAESGKPSAVVLLGNVTAVTSSNVLHPNGIRYAGDVVGSQAIVSYAGPTGLRVQLDDAGAGIAISMDDEIRFDHRGIAYRVVSKSLVGPPWIFDLQPQHQLPPIPNPPNWFLVAPTHASPGIPGYPGTAKYDFVAYRRPNSSSRFPVDLPGATCVDLSGSGYGVDDDTFGTGSAISGPVIIEVQPSGRIGAVRFGGIEQTPMAPIYLMIGQLDAVGLRVGSVAENVTDANSLWVRIDRTSGRVEVLPNGWSQSRPTLANSRTL